ncbi:hypothetical protein SUGI_0318850 [Cryptomeria japonica]|nr:hypothetical protein SUGI_0318850 [Cryptomeria japonica]
MYDLPMFQRALLHPKFSFSKQNWVSWDFHYLNLKLLPSIFIQTAKLSRKSGVEPQAEIPVNVKHQVQQVLQDYLYYTREFNFTDARDISINAPCFIHKLLSRVRQKKDLTRALKKRLLYNPINEFEPFFESIGIKPCDIHSLLPQDQLFMKESQALLAAVSTLSNIGFPRQELGKLYKEHPNVFICSSKELQNKLQFYENLGVSKASLVRIIISCPSVLNDDLYRNFMVVIIGLNCFQLEKSRNSCLMDSNLHNRGITLENLMLLVGIGCSWDEISKFFYTKSDLLNNGSEESLRSIIEFLSSLGIQRENICSCVLTCPEILNPELVKSMEIGAASVGLYQETREKIDSYRGKLIKLLECTVGMVFEKQNFSAFIKKHLKNPLWKVDPKNIQFMLSDGVNVVNKASPKNPENIQLMLLDGVDVVNKASPENFQSIMMEGVDLANRKKDLVVDRFLQKHSASVREIQMCEHLHRLIPRHTLNIFLKVGLAKSSKKMNEAVSRIECTSDKLQERFSYLLGLGLPFCAVCKILWWSPTILSQSLNSLQKKADFLFRSVSNPLQVLESYPIYLNYSLKRRIMPRYKLYKWLRSNNVLKSELGITSIIRLSEKSFEKKYVMIHSEGRNYFRQCMLTCEHASSPQENLGVEVVDKAGPENFQSLMMEGGDLVNRKTDLIVDSFPQKHSASVREIQICEHLHRHIRRHTLNIFLKVGLAKSSKKMNVAVSRIECTSDKLQERFSYLLGLGLPFCAVCKILWRSPTIFSQSLNSLQKKADFLFRSVNNPLQVLESYPKYLNYSLERRIMPRYELYKWLRTNNVLKSELGIMSIIKLSEKSFEKKYLKLHPKGSKYFRQCNLTYEHASSAQENHGVDVVDKASPENFQRLMMEGGDLANKKKDLIVDSFPQKHSASVREIQICEHLNRCIRRHTLNIFLKVGLAKSSKKMNVAVSRIECTSDKLQERFSYLLGLGLPFCAVCKILWWLPTIFSQSLNSLQKKADFLFRSVSNPLQVLESYPKYLNYSLERRIMPRYELYKWLRTNNVLKSELGIMSIIKLSEKSFEKIYVKLHPKGSKYFRQCKLTYEHASSAQENHGVDVGDKASLENFQRLMMEGGDLANKKKDLIVDSFPQKHYASVREIQICEHLNRCIRRHTLNIFLKVGLAKSSKKMNVAVSRIECTSDKLQERFSYFLGLGLPFCAVCKILWWSPTIFSQSLNSLQKKADFLFRSVSNPLQVLESYPKYLNYSLERRIMPRYELYKWLRTNNVLKSELGIMSIIKVSEKSFEKKYVKLHPQGSKYFRQCKLTYEHASSAQENHGVDVVDKASPEIFKA